MYVLIVATGSIRSQSKSFSDATKRFGEARSNEEIGEITTELTAP